MLSPTKRFSLCIMRTLKIFALPCLALPCLALPFSNNCLLFLFSFSARNIRAVSLCYCFVENIQDYYNLRDLLYPRPTCLLPSRRYRSHWQSILSPFYGAGVCVCGFLLPWKDWLPSPLVFALWPDLPLPSSLPLRRLGRQWPPLDTWHAWRPLGIRWQCACAYELSWDAFWVQ
jgi:hypothetical protein